MERIKAPSPEEAGLRKKTLTEYWQSVKQSVKPKVYKCPLCQDSAWRLVDYGGHTVAVACDCRATGRAERLVRLSRLAESDLQYTLADCWNAEARSAAQGLLARNGWLTLTGPFGTGKSFVLKATVNEARLAGRTALYITMSDLLQHLRECFDPETQTMSYSALWRNVTECSVLAIDEVDRYNPTPWAESELFRLVNERYTQWSGRATMWAVNDFSAVVGYLRDRMLDGRFNIIKLTGQSVRPMLSLY